MEVSAYLGQSPRNRENFKSDVLLNEPIRLMDEEFVATLRRFYRSGFDGLVREEDTDADPVGLTLGFNHGDVIVSDAALAVLSKDERWIAYIRHGLANWGDVDSTVAEKNFHALEHGGELLSVYYTKRDVRFTVITKRDRTCTSIQLEHEPPAWG
jgi:hypothetical protein